MINMININNLNETIENNETITMLKPLFGGARVYLVGGFLRDCLLGRVSCDIDFVVEDACSCALAKKIADEVDGHFVALDEENKIYRVVFADKVHYVDFADCTGKSIEDDLKRRDFTINALAYDINNSSLIDLTGGLDDLNASEIREISKENMLDDPIRILRAFRFQSELGFSISDGLKVIIKEHASLLDTTAKERVNVELIKLFGGNASVETLRSLDENGLLELLIPEVSDIKKIPENSHHHLNLFEHSLETVNQLQAFYEQACGAVREHLDSEFLGGQKRICYLKLASFLHDVGKPSTWQVDPQNGRHRFIMHDSEGAKLIASTLRNLKFSKKQIAYVQKIIKNHIYPAGVVTSDETSEKAYLRFYRKMENETIDLVALAYADRLSALGPDITKEMIDKNLNGLKSLLDGYLAQLNKMPPLPKLLDGKEIMALLGIEASPKLGEIIESLKEAQISSEVSTKDEAINFIKNCLK